MQPRGEILGPLRLIYRWNLYFHFTHGHYMYENNEDICIIIKYTMHVWISVNLNNLHINLCMYNQQLLCNLNWLLSIANKDKDSVWIIYVITIHNNGNAIGRTFFSFPKWDLRKEFFFLISDLSYKRIRNHVVKIRKVEMWYACDFVILSTLNIQRVRIVLMKIMKYVIASYYRHFLLHLWILI